MRTVLQIRNWDTPLMLTLFHKKLTPKNGSLHVRLYCTPTDEVIVEIFYPSMHPTGALFKFWKGCKVGVKRWW